MSDAPANTAELLLLADERQVYAFDLSTVARVKIGRHASNDLQLTSRTVSNFHAEIRKANGELVVQDLGSTNGTQVNGRRIEAEPVVTGDRIRIGNHLMTMQLKPTSTTEKGPIRFENPSNTLGHGTKGQVISMRSRSADLKQTLRSNDPNDMLLSDLLKLLSASRKPLRLTLTREGDEAHIFVREQRVVHVEYGTAVGEKALYRLFNWHESSYVIEEPPSTEEGLCSVSLPIDTLIMEGMEHALELGKLIATLPPLGARLFLKEDCPLPMTAHSAAEIEIFQLIIRHETIGRVLEHSALSDVRILRLIQSLMQKGVFEAARRTQSTTEETANSMQADTLLRWSRSKPPDFPES